MTLIAEGLHHSEERRSRRRRRAGRPEWPPGDGGITASTVEPLPAGAPAPPASRPIAIRRAAACLNRSPDSSASGFYGPPMVLDQAEVSPDSKPSANSEGTQLHLPIREEAIPPAVAKPPPA